MTPDEVHGQLGASVLDLGDDRRLHRADVGHERRAGIERGDDHLGDLPDRHCDHGEVGTVHRVGQRRRDTPDGTRGERGVGAFRVTVEADDVVPGLPEREARSSRR